MRKLIQYAGVALLLATLGATLFASRAEAQNRGGFGFHGNGRGPGYMHRAGGFFAFAPYYPDYGSEIVEVPVPQIVQPPEPAPATPERKPGESLMLELQGDHWVRVTNYGQSQSEEPLGPPESKESGARRTQAAAEPSPELPSAVLVFRDGRQEEVRKYMIVGSTIYASADYWTSGSWTQKVQIADLNVPETLKLNRERGARFSLPSSPNEIMVRP
jgi:hypothetical protein